MMACPVAAVQEAAGRFSRGNFNKPVEDRWDLERVWSALTVQDRTQSCKVSRPGELIKGVSVMQSRIIRTILLIMVCHCTVSISSAGTVLVYDPVPGSPSSIIPALEKILSTVPSQDIRTWAENNRVEPNDLLLEDLVRLSKGQTLSRLEPFCVFVRF